MNKFQQLWDKWESKFVDLTQREKIIIYLAVPFLIAFAMFKVSIEPQLGKIEAQKKKQSSLATQLVSVNTQINEIQNALKVDPNEKIKAEIKVIRSKIDELDTKLQKVMTEYIAPEKMATALTSLLKTSNNIRVVGITALPAEQIQHNTELSLPNYYRHQFEVNIEGGYFALMDFVKKVSRNNAQFSVQNLDYKVTNHPTALMTLRLVTISDNKNVIRL